METVTPFKEAIDAIKEAGGEAAKLCYQCGLCNTVCPLNKVRKFDVRKIIRQAQFGLSEIEREETWLCVTCGNCVHWCPRGVDIISIAMSLRRFATEWSAVPHSIHRAGNSLASEGNPWGEERGKRADWAKDISIKTFTEDTKFLYFPCCGPSYDPRLIKIAKATANILQKAGVDFGILGPKENCCGESIRKAGDEDLFKRLAKENIKNFVEDGVKRIVVTSPHCYHTFKNEYPEEFMVNFEVTHISQFLIELIDSGRLKFEQAYEKKVTYHDPCYLGRHNNIYDAPREILRRIPGLELVEMGENRENSLCCGGGGGGIWMDVPMGERLSDVRLAQALDTGASVMASFCPYCMLNFENSRLTLEDSDVIEIKDVTEIIEELI